MPPRTALAITTAPTAYADTTQAITFTPASLVVAESLPEEEGNDGDKFGSTGREVVLVRNVVGDASPKTVTVASVPCIHGRSADLDAQSIADTKVYVLPFFRLDGWEQSDRAIYVNGEDENIEIAVIRIPD